MLLQHCRTAGLEDAATACMDAYALVSSVKDTKIACMHYKIAIAIACMHYKIAIAIAYQ
jgi:hypothetical protein